MPTIDISMIARFDELGVPIHQRPPDVVDGGGLAAAVGGTPASQLDARAFEPPSTTSAKTDDAPLGVERSTRAIRIEREFQNAAVRKAPTHPSAPAPRSVGGIVLIAVVVIVALAIGVLLLVGR